MDLFQPNFGLPDRSVYNSNRSINVVDDNGNLCYYDFSECCWYVVETSGQGGVYLLDPPPKMWSYLPDAQFELQRAKTLQDVANFLSDLDIELKFYEFLLDEVENKLAKSGYSVTRYYGLDFDIIVNIKD